MPAKKKSSAMRGMRLYDGMYKAIVQTAKTRQFASPSAFMRAAIDKELRGSDSALNESEQRISASLERNLKEIRRVSTAQQALFAYVDALAKVILSSLPEMDEQGRKSAVARGKLRYSRFIKSVGANMAGDAGEALSELVNHAEER